MMSVRKIDAAMKQGRSVWVIHPHSGRVRRKIIDRRHVETFGAAVAAPRGAKRITYSVRDVGICETKDIFPNEKSAKEMAKKRSAKMHVSRLRRDFYDAAMAAKFIYRGIPTTPAERREMKAAIKAVGEAVERLHGLGF